MSWLYQFRVAGVTVQVDSDSTACEQDMRKFLRLYESVAEQEFDLRFYVRTSEAGYHFMFENRDGMQLALWSSEDEREITAALEIHLYSQLIQWLDERCDVVSLHSALLVAKGQPVMFAGVSGAGKSSMCTAGLLAGAAYCSDEFSLLDGQGLVHPFPRPMQWEHETHPAFDRQAVQNSGLIQAGSFDFPDAKGGMARCFLWYPTHVQRKPLPLRHVVLHQYDAELDAPQLSEIPRHEALMALPEHLHVQRGMAKDLPMLNRRIPKDCKFYRLGFPDAMCAWREVERVLND